MCCALRHLPVTDFLSDHPFSNMSDRGPSPHRRIDDNLPLRTSLPSRESTKEDQRHISPILDTSRDARAQQSQAPHRHTPSPTPASEQRPTSQSPSAERMRQITPRSISIEPHSRDQHQSYASTSTLQPGSVPTGQICRYVVMLWS